jgi:hypothetical protein
MGPNQHNADQNGGIMQTRSGHDMAMPNRAAEL